MKLLDYFKENYGVKNLGDITWSHAVNSLEKLDRVVNDQGIMFIESDIRLSNKGIPIVAHPPKTESDLNFEELVNKMSGSKQCLKLDFKDSEILVECLKMLGDAKLAQLVLLNADILKGNGAGQSKFNPQEFISQCTEIYPSGILSVGWTTVADLEFSYTKENVDEMLELCETFDEVTFPVRACLLPNSWSHLKRLIEKDGFSLSVWNNEPVDQRLQKWIKENTDPQKTFYDFTNENKEPLRFW